MGRLVAYLGGQRSGKSALAEARLGRAGAFAYVSTLKPGRDAELKLRVQAHRSRRGPAWKVFDGLKGLLMSTKEAKASGCRALLLDGLGAWAAWSMGKGIAAMDRELKEFLRYSKNHFKTTVLTLDETGLGGVSANKAARRFADLNGALNQAVCAEADEVHWVMSGIGVKVKG